MSSKRRKMFVALGTVAALAVGAVAVAYFTGADGSGTGSASVGSSTQWGVAVSPGSGTIYAGAGTDVIPFTVTNNGNGHQNLLHVTYSIKQDSNGNAESADGNTVYTGCLASWFSTSAHAGNPSMPADLAPAGTYQGSVDVTMPDLSSTNQDACQGKSPGVIVTASSS
jgi:hypothetical protein